MAERAVFADAECKEIERKWWTGGFPPMVLKDQTTKILTRYQLTSKPKRIPNMQVGTFPGNRGKGMLQISEIPTKTMKLHKGGFSNSQVHAAICIGRPHGALGDKWESDCQKLAKLSNGKIPLVLDGSIKVFSLVFNHTKEVLRCLESGAACEDPEIATHGKYDTSKVCAHQPSFLEAVSEGMYWHEIDPIVQERWPTLLDVICQADNINAQIARPDSIIEIVRAVVDDARRHRDHENRIGWATTEQRVGALQPNRPPSDITDARLFAEKWSGGLDDPWVLNRIDEHLKTLDKPSDANPQILGKLGLLVFPPKQGTHFVAGVVKTMHFSLDANKNRESKYFVPGDITKYQNADAMKQVLAADHIMRQALSYVNILIIIDKCFCLFVCLSFRLLSSMINAPIFGNQ